MLTAVADEDQASVIMSCLTIALLNQVRDPTTKQLQDGVKGASEWITLYASSLDPNSDIQSVN